jgi:hypothetical protein
MQLHWETRQTHGGHKVSYSLQVDLCTHLCCAWQVQICSDVVAVDILAAAVTVSVVYTTALTRHRVPEQLHPSPLMLLACFDLHTSLIC